MPRHQFQTGPSHYRAHREGDAWFVYEEWFEATRYDEEEDQRRLVKGPISEAEAKALAFQMEEGNKAIEAQERDARLKKLLG